MNDRQMTEIAEIETVLESDRLREAEAEIGRLRQGMDKIRTWEYVTGRMFIDQTPEKVMIELFTVYQRDTHTRVHYVVQENDRPLFVSVIGVPPHMAIDSDQTIETVIHMITLKIGDTDQEYFDQYSADLLEWTHSRTASELRELSTLSTEIGSVRSWGDLASADSEQILEAGDLIMPMIEAGELSDLQIAIAIMDSWQ